MYARSITLAVALVASTSPTWAATANVDIYGAIPQSVDTVHSTYGTYSAAADIGNNFFSVNSGYTPKLDVTTSPGVTAQIAGADYSASARTTVGSNHAFAQAGSFATGTFGAASFSGWYDQVTLTGGTGSGTANFTIQLNGTVDVGAIAGGMSYALVSSRVHPSQLASQLTNIITPSSAQPWAMDAAAPIATYLMAASPYNDTSILFPGSVTPPPGGLPWIPAIDGVLPLEGADMGFPEPDLVLTPGAGQALNVTLQGTLNFTYGEAFYLIGGLGTTVIGDGLGSFCAFGMILDTPCSAPIKDGTGATTLDFSHSANLINIALPAGTTASFASGNAYNVTSVPEPAEWLTLLAGLGLVGWRARRR